jgi:glycerophosphoryl diester phosphodiesterase
MSSSLDAVRAGGPFVVAHRAGNDLRVLRRAQSARVAVVEADLHLFAKRIEVRHLKTLGPIPLLWDKWTVASPRTPRLLLEDLLQAAAPSTILMLDLKDRDRRLSAGVAAALREQPREHTVCCSQNWVLLEEMQDLDGVQVVHSVGNRRQLHALRRQAATRPLDGVSIHHKLLGPCRVRELRRLAGLVMSWPVRTLADVRQLLSWGVDGLITEHFEVLAPLLRRTGTRLGEAG